MLSQPEQELSRMQHGDHICAVHDSTAEQATTGVAFTRIGLERGERCIYVTDDSTYEMLDLLFTAAGVDFDAEQKRGALTILPGRATFLRAGEFNVEPLIAFLAASEREALAAGYSGLRFQTEMSWALHDADVSGARLLEYEMGINTYLRSSHTVVACHHLHDSINTTSIRDTLRTHPSLVITGRACPNPYYEAVEVASQPSPIALREFKRKRLGWWVTRLRVAMAGGQAPGQSLQESHDREELVQNLLDSTDEAIYGMDLEGRCTLANPTCARLLGYSSPAELTGKIMHDLIHHHHADGSERAIDASPIHRVLTTQQSTHNADDVFWRQDGTALNVEYWAYPMRSSEALSGVVVTFIDITSKKALEHQLRQSQKMEEIGRLAGGVAHDFNNLLTVINGYSELLLNLTPEDDPKWEFIEQIRNAGERSGSLTRQLLALSDKPVLAPRLLDLNGVILDMEKMLRRAIGEDIQLSMNLNPGLGDIEADPSQLEHILLNLMVNAKDAMPTGGKMRVETDNLIIEASASPDSTQRVPGQYIRLSVADSGDGMTDFVKGHVFDPLFTTKSARTGLGLAVVYDIVTQSGGHIEVASNPGEGTVFHAYFPRIEPALSVPLDKVELSEIAQAYTILLVEDDESVRGLIKFTLLESGYSVLEASNASEAFRICAKANSPIHLLVTDVVLPETSGPILAGKLSVIYPQMRILFLSGYTDGAVVRHGISPAEVNFLQKPFSPATLAEKVRVILKG